MRAVQLVSAITTSLLCAVSTSLAASSPHGVAGPGQKVSYTQFWNTVKDFQSLIAALIGLVAVVGAIYGVRLQAKLASSAAERLKRATRIRTATTIRSLIAIEGSFPATSFLRPPTEDEVYRILTTGTGFELGTADYVSYLKSFAMALAEFPSAISERASFLSWASGRIALAMVRVSTASPTMPIAKTAAVEVRLLLLAAILVTDELDAELATYIRVPVLYEERWRESPLTDRWVHTCVSTHSSNAFNLEKLKEKVRLAASVTPKAGSA